MKFTAIQIATILEGEVVGDENIEVDKLSKIEEGEAGSLTFLSNPKYTNYIYSTRASITIVNDSFEPEQSIETTLIKVEDAYKAFSKLLEFYNEVRSNRSGIEEPHYMSDSVHYGDHLYLGAFAYIGINVKIGKNVKIYPHVYIGENVVIGDNTTIFSGAKIYSETIIGNNCTVHSGAIIGADGFGFAPDESGKFQEIPQIGNVVIENHVSIGAGTSIDRATLGSTLIKEGVKLDNQIQIGHNVVVGRNTVIAAQTGIAGSTKIGANCMIGGQCGFAGHITVGDNVKIQGQTGIIGNIEDNEVLMGTPAMNYTSYNKSYVYFKRLPDLVANISKLEKEIQAIKNTE
jgi:UDP-3-O-[3-hydroxymyristoyl] glucosamine N-acyltransferase